MGSTFLLNGPNIKGGTMRYFSYILTLVMGFALGIALFSEDTNVESPEVVIKMIPEAPELNPEIMCLARNIYFEARNESAFGQLAVASVTLNRVDSTKFPNTICEVVHQAKYSKWWAEAHGKKVPVRNQCQFSWYCDGKSDKIFDHKIYEKIYKLAEVAYNTDIDITDGATHYHADYVNPSWASHMKTVAKVDTHIFYKMPQ